MKIHKCSDQLPPNNTWVLAHFPNNPWGSNDAPNNEHKWVVVKFVEGISKVNRKDMQLGLLPDPLYNGNYKRSSIYCAEDEHSNNLVAYNWVSFGPDSFFGQTASVWTYLPKP